MPVALRRGGVTTRDTASKLWSIMDDNGRRAVNRRVVPGISSALHVVYSSHSDVEGHVLAGADSRGIVSKDGLDGDDRPLRARLHLLVADVSAS